MAKQAQRAIKNKHVNFNLKKKQNHPEFFKKKSFSHTNMMKNGDLIKIIIINSSL